jgi:hypothetical protein
MSHFSRDSRQAVAVKAWLIREPELAEGIFLDLDPHTGIRPGERWKEALNEIGRHTTNMPACSSSPALRRNVRRASGAV